MNPHSLPPPSHFNVQMFVATKPGHAHKTLKLMGARPGDDDDTVVPELSEFRDRNLSKDQVADEVGDYFATISQEFEPVNIAALPADVRNAIAAAKPDHVPVITPDEVGLLICQSQSNKGMTKGDLLPRLYKASVSTLKYPISIIFNRVAKSGQWPQRWKVENSFIRRKVPNPRSLDDMRAISKSPLLSNLFEKLVVKWLLGYIEHHIDWAQYGGMKGCSVAHLMIELSTFPYTFPYNPQVSF